MKFGEIWGSYCIDRDVKLPLSPVLDPDYSPPRQDLDPPLLAGVKAVVALTSVGAWATVLAQGAAGINTAIAQSVPEFLALQEPDGLHDTAPGMGFSLRGIPLAPLV